MRNRYLSLILPLLGTFLHAQTTLTTGDIAIIGYNTDDPDQVVFVPMVDLAAGTTIYFTDNAWTGTALTTNEGTYTYTAGAAVTKGTAITLSTTGMSLALTGDQVIAYQGSAASPTFIYALSSNTWITTGTTTTNTSYLPTGLTAGTSAISFTTERDDGYYNVTTISGNKSDLLASIASTANWTTTDTRVSPFPTWSITVTSFAPEPTANPTALTFTGVKSWSFGVSFTAATGSPAGYIVIRRAGAAPTSNPVDGVTYAQGDNIGNAKVAYIGTGTSFAQYGIIAATTYHYKIYAYNGSGALINYRQTSPLTGSQATTSTDVGSYYSSINHTASTFVTDLKTRVRSPYTKVTYDNFDETNVTYFAFRDTTGGQRVTTCIYSGQLYSYTPPFTWYTSSPFSREHTWCHSWMPTYASTSGNEYADQHHLFPVNQANANGVRSNHPLGEVVTVLSSYLEGSYGYDASGNTVYEPRASHKGDAARALLYMSLRYDGVNSKNWTFNYLNGTTLPALSEDAQDITTLLTWHTNDPPDNYEIARNDYVCSIQQNRNPFVDNPTWTNYISWGDLSFIPHRLAGPDTDPAPLTFDIQAYPVPMVDHLSIDITSPTEEEATIQLYTAQGVEVLIMNHHATNGTTTAVLPTADLSPGVYLIRVLAGNQQQSLRLVK
jgi:endonuclease I